MYETFDHTADLGLRIRAENLNALFAEAGRALFAVIVDNPESIRPEQSVTVHLDFDNKPYLLFDWLSALLYHFDVEHLLFARFDVFVNDQGLNATVWGEPLDPGRHELAHEVKAITYHGLRVEPAPGGWLAEVIVDI